MFEELSKIAMQSGNCRLVLSYSGEDKFALGICDGLATPLVDFLLDLRREGKISETVFQKVARENAIRVLRL